MISHLRSHRARPLDLLWDRRSLRDRNGLLVVAENTGLEHGVLNVAELIARRDQINAHLVGIAEPVTATPRFTPQERADLTEGKLHRLRRRTRQLLHHAVGRGGWWTVDAALGTVSRVLAEETRRRAPRLVMVPLEESGDERIRRVERLISAATITNTPVLAVPAHQQLLPVRALIATDFSAASVRAALASLPILGQGAKVTLLHVEPEVDYLALGHPELRDASEEGVARLFDQLRRDLGEAAAKSVARPRLEIESLFLRGDPGRTVLDHADREHSDLIVIGVRPAREAIRPDGVASVVLREARTAILIAPAPEQRPEADLVRAGASDE